jgi:Alpha galactosidase A
MPTVSRPADLAPDRRRLDGGGARRAGSRPPRAGALALNNGLVRTPPMGFNSWNTTHCSSTFNETLIRGIADKFVSVGLREVGYNYVNIDDCWGNAQVTCSA